MRLFSGRKIYIGVGFYKTGHNVLFDSVPVLAKVIEISKHLNSLNREDGYHLFTI